MITKHGIWVCRAIGRTRDALLARYPPDAYGISYQELSVPELMRGPKAGLYVLSAHLVAFLPAIGAEVRRGDGKWLREVPPTAVVGHSYYV